MFQPKVYIIVLNYNRWRDTVECLESVLKLNYTNYQIVLVDNHSTDDSIQKLKEWMNGEVKIDWAINEKLKQLSFPAVLKPVSFSIGTDGKKHESNTSEIIFLTSEENLGYAGGNNLGIRYGLKREDADYFWILNNDTVVPEDCLNNLVIHFEELINDGQELGVLGSKLRFYDAPEMLQGIGAVFNKFTSKIKQIGTFEDDKGQYDANNIRIDFVIGASIFVSKEMVERAGVMAEEYFLYNEEIDWCFRAKKRGFLVSYASDSIIYHKQGTSTKNSVKAKKKNVKAMFYQFRNIILFYKKFYPTLIFIPMSVVSLRIIKFSLTDKRFFSLLYPVLTLQKYFKSVNHK